jgi:transcriptional regulator with XRE-family HTH domain
MEKIILTTIKTKIDKIMRAQGLKRYSLAEKAGIANPTLQNWFSDRNYQPSLYSLIRVCNVLKISLSELFLLDNEEMYPLDKESKDLVESYKMLNEEGRDLIKTMMKNLKKD